MSHGLAHCGPLFKEEDFSSDHKLKITMEAFTEEGAPTIIPSLLFPMSSFGVQLLEDEVMPRIH